MTKYFAGNSLAAFSRTSPSIVESTSTSVRDTAYVPNAINLKQNTNISTPVFASPATTMWLRFDWYNSTTWAGSTGDRWMEFFNSSGTMVGRFRYSSSNATVTWQYWDGSAFVSGGTYTNSATNTRLEFAMKFVCGATGSVEIYLSGALETTLTIGDAAMDNISRVVMYGVGSIGSYVSQVMIADYDLRDSHFMVPALDGNSAANTDGTGDYTDVGETVLDDGTAVKLTTATHKRGQTMAAITVPSGLGIGAMVISGRGRVAGTITDGKLGVRGSGGTNSSGSGLSYNSGYEPRQRIVETDPDTAAAFTQSGFNAAEIYEEAA